MQHGDFHGFRPWGYVTPTIKPMELVDRVKEATASAIATAPWAVLLEGPIACEDCEGFARISVEVPLPNEVFDQLMNGACGYRAHYAASATVGESFNRLLIEAVAPLVVQAEHLYDKKFGRTLCEKSLLGAHSKFWYSRAVSDPISDPWLSRLKEELEVPQWKDFWARKPRPRKGLLAPNPEEPSVLLNGTFVNDADLEFEQKSGRSEQLHRQGWT